MLPIVLHHGLLGFGRIAVGPFKFSGFRGIDRAITARGHRVMISHVHPTAGIERRATQLRDQVVRQLDLWRADRCIITAHSMGGLDARYAITCLGLCSRVAALLSITSPHRGSTYAQWFLTNIYRHAQRSRVAHLSPIDLRGFLDLTPDRCTQFNQTVRDSPAVRYYSVGCEVSADQIPLHARHSHRVIAAAEGANDGLVSVQSSRWGNYLMTWPLNHWQVINSAFVAPPPDGCRDCSPRYLAALSTVLRDLT